MAKPRIPGTPKVEPWKPADYELADVQALQALARGDCPEHLQRRALKFVIETLCDTYGMSYRPQSSRDTDFAEGKRHVGNQIVKLLHLNLSTMRRDNA